MKNRPLIATAIPKRRYQIGNHNATVLGDIESGDAQRYRYILALVPDGKKEPVLYVCAEPTPAAQRADGAYQLRIISATRNQILDTHDRWSDLEIFSEQALDLVTQVLNLQHMPISRLL